MNGSLTHLDAEGKAHMVDVTDKQPTVRSAVAKGSVAMQEDTLNLIQQGGHKKGDVFAVARIAGIQGAKQTANLIPLCHPLALGAIDVAFDVDKKQNRVLITARCKLSGTTGVEMEALSAVSVAALTIYDMCKAVDKTMCIGDIRVVKKSGGKSDWQTP